MNTTVNEYNYRFKLTDYALFDRNRTRKVAIYDNISVEDLKTYQKVLVSVGNFDNPQYTIEDEGNYAKLSLNNLFHEICHRYVHADREYNISKLPITCKSVLFNWCQNDLLRI